MNINEAVKIVTEYEKRFLLAEVQSVDIEENMDDLTLTYVIESAFINHSTDKEIIEKAKDIKERLILINR